ncbi:guanitoxin biosynthesis L-enduracididine beta-hydroxylase GntD [Lentzea albidocapillata]|uniref:Arginine beta-hydroxylase, Fe(II)/alpha-ketoglutarate-dependent n=1 Tax=Lentzea albidocapillata TaxID=40571 RepID=A0A1W2CUK5_9PSEU|nr:guanitoxin biosynthesis L-enduracididine beta-hydroxylase GntD [Lentzea albidocapillata]SMC88929.1 arginine beta-hydroxylase, Fe(II)/alpha-ketoglutarate-dependent [Lentzea albidocapillata]
MRRITMSAEEAQSAVLLAGELAREYGSSESPEFLRDAPVAAHDLPRRVREEFHAFKLLEDDCLLVLAGYPIDEDKIGPTPAHWNKYTGNDRTLEEEIYLFLCSSLLGDPIGWATQQDGRVLHDVLPIKGHEDEQMGSGSEQLLAWHTEDAFHPMRADYIGLMCLRNNEQADTTFAPVADLRLALEVADVLREESFPIRPDRSHLPAHFGGGRSLSDEEKVLLERSYEWITRLDEKPESIAVLFGDDQRPYLRIDPYFMETDSLCADSHKALDTICAEIDRVIQGYTLQPGETLFLDNFTAVHGRRPFKAHSEATRRWLKRSNVVRDLRKSRSRRVRSESRIIT